SFHRSFLPCREVPFHDEGSNTMRTRLKKVLAGVGALAALALGGAAITQAGSSPPQHNSSDRATEQERGAPNERSADRENAQDESRNESGKDEKSNGRKSKNKDGDTPI